MADAWTYGLHYVNGRVEGGQANGHMLVLGNLDESRLAEFAGGDFIAFEQNIDVTDYDYIVMWIKGAILTGFTIEIIFDAQVQQQYNEFEPHIADDIFIPFGINVAFTTGIKNLKFQLRKLP